MISECTVRLTQRIICWKLSSGHNKRATQWVYESIHHIICCLKQWKIVISIHIFSKISWVYACLKSIAAKQSIWGKNVSRLGSLFFILFIFFLLYVTVLFVFLYHWFALYIYIKFFSKSLQISIYYQISIH